MPKKEAAASEPGPIVFSSSTSRRIPLLGVAGRMPVLQGARTGRICDAPVIASRVYALSRNQNMSESIISVWFMLSLEVNRVIRGGIRFAIA